MHKTQEFPKLSKSLLISLLVLLAVSMLLRYNINTYAYGKDEIEVFKPLVNNENPFSNDFIFSVKRPPMQYQLVKVLNTVGVDYKSEGTMRLPFMVAGLISIFGLFFYIRELTNSDFASLIGALLFSVNGFVVALSKMVQYQSFVMMFSVLTVLLFYTYSKKPKLQFLTLGIVLFSVGFYFHWDMVFVLPIISLYALKGIKTNERHFLFAVLAVLPIIFMYIVPYASSGDGAVKTGYLVERLGFFNTSLKTQYETYKYMIELYNPFVYLYFLIGAFMFSTVAAFKKPAEYFWLLTVFLGFAIFITRPGTHIYNALLPLSVTVGISIAYIFNICSQSTNLKKPAWICKTFVGTTFIVLVSFFTYQSYLLFVDTTHDYPWSREILFNKWKTQKYTFENSSRYMIGFPSNRYFKEAATQLQKVYPDYYEFTFNTNENSLIASFYLDLQKKDSDKMFIFSVKEPVSFVEDAKFKEYKGKNEILKLKDPTGRTMNKVYVWYEIDSEE